MIRTKWIDTISKDTTPLRLILELSKPYKWVALLSLFFGALASGLNALVPLVYKHLVDTITQVAQNTAPFSNIWFWCLIYVGAIFGNAIFWRLVGLTGGVWVTGIRATGRDSITRYVLQHSHEYFENRFAGSISSKIGNANDGAYNLTENFFWHLWPLVVGLCVSSYITFMTNVWVGATFVLWLAILIPLNVYLAKKKLAVTLKTQELETGLRGRTVDFLTNIRAVQEFGGVAQEVKKLRELIHERRKVGFKNRMIGEGMILLNSILQMIFMLLMLGMTLWLASRGEVSVGSVILVLSLVLSVGADILWIGNNISFMSDRWGEIVEGLKDLYVPYTVTDVTVKGANTKISDGEVKFTNASFAYEGREDVITGFDLHIPTGTKVGLVGKSGAGKSTLIKLLMRHYDVTGGAITIGGHDIAKITRESVRDAIAIVPQEPLLFHRTIRENIAYGLVGASDEEVRSAAKLARADDFIGSLPLGYETIVGERGVKLSGGERQRVAIARAMIKHAPVLILDEATSALDSESEKAIQEALHTLMEGKTVIAIAHRLSTLREMDRILVLDQGKIVEDGSHEVLLKAGGIYATLWDHQSGGYMKDE